MGDLDPPWPWDSAQATRQGLSDRIRDRFPREQASRRLTEIAFRRLLVRLTVGLDAPWALCGGVALALRLARSRTSADVDLVVPALDRTAGDVRNAIAGAAAVTCGDFLCYELTAPRDADRSLVDGDVVELRAVATLGSTAWAAFPIDIAVAAAPPPIEHPERLQPLTGLAEVDGIPGLPVIPIAHQLAQKTCAMFEIHGACRTHSTRARDLADVAMSAQQVRGVAAADLTRALADEAAIRLRRGSLAQPLPARLALDPTALDDWARRWDRATMHAGIGFAEAHAIAGRFLTPVLAGIATGTWHPDEERWA